MHRHEHGFTDERRMLVALVLTGGFMVAEIIGGLISGALALLADAGHMLIDTAALAMAFMAARMGRRPADALRSYGYHRLQILAAFVNGLAFVPSWAGSWWGRCSACWPRTRSWVTSCWWWRCWGWGNFEIGSNQPAQQESCRTSLRKVWAQSLSPSTMVRYGNS